MDAASISAILAGIGGIITALSGAFVLFRKQNTEDYAELSKSVIKMKEDKTDLESTVANLRKELTVCKSESLTRIYDLDNAHRQAESRLRRQIIEAGLEPVDTSDNIKKVNDIIEAQKNY